MLRKLFFGLLVFVILFFAAAIAVPLLFKDQIVAKVKTIINDNLTAKVDFKDFDVSLLRSFPDLSFSLEELSVIGTDTFKTDTLAAIKELYVKVDIMTVLKGEPIQVKSFRLFEPRIHAKVLKNGKANWDIAKPDTTVSTDTAATTFTVGLQSYEISKGTLVYDDASLGFYTQLTGLDHTGKGDFTQDLFTLLTHTSAKELTLKYEGITYISKATAMVEMPLDIDLKNSIYTFHKTEATLNALNLGFEGLIEMPADDIKMDIQFSADKSDFKNFLSMIPAIYSSSFADLTASGKFAMSGYAKGIYNDKSMPGFGVNLLVENGSFKYPSLPTAVNHVGIKASITNPDGNMDKTVISVPVFHIELGTEPFDARLLVKTPISDPDIDAALKGRIDLGAITKIVPLDGMTLAGILTADVMAKGHLSAVEKGHYENFNASGQAALVNFSYSSKDLALPAVSIRQTQLLFNPRAITLVGFDAKVGKSDFQADGKLENYIAYALKGDPIAGKLNLHSSILDVNELMGPPSTTAATPDTAAMTVVEVPSNVNFVLNSAIDKMLYDKLTIEQLVGKIVVANSTLSFQNVALKTLDAEIGMNGSYSTREVKQPKVDMTFGIQNMDIQKAFKAFNTIQKLAPVAEHAKGIFSMNLGFKSDLGADMSPVLSTVNGEGSMYLSKAVIEGSDLTNKLADALKQEKFKRFELTATKVQFKLLNGRLEVKPFDTKIAGAQVNIGGSSGLDQSIAYTLKMQLPRNLMGGATNNVLEGLVAKANSNGANLNLGETINVNGLVGGTVLKPTLTLSMGDLKNNLKNAAQGIVDNAKKQLEDKAKAELDKAKAEADRMKSEASAKAQAQANQLIADAQQKADAVKREAGKLADKIRQEGNAQAQKLESEAKNPLAKAAAKKAADKIRQESDAKANGIVSEANKSADNIMNSAKEQAAKLKGN